MTTYFVTLVSLCPQKMNRLSLNNLKSAVYQASNRTANKRRNTRYGKGSNGQKARHHVKIGFNGSTIPFWKRFPKIGSMVNDTFKLYGVRSFQSLTITQLVNKMDRMNDLKLLKDTEGRPLIHIVDLFERNLVHKLHPTTILNGIPLQKSIHLVVSRISEAAKQNIENAGGVVTIAYHTKVGLSQLHKRVYKSFQEDQPEAYLYHQLRNICEVPPKFLAGKYYEKDGYLNEERQKLLPLSGLYIAFKMQHPKAPSVSIENQKIKLA
eukprot:NODE_98_length_20568_cov_1.409546.p7 type:complete len:266 gc:universal NODE_98_length_20568_cov_1.409546:13249-12452(-)